MVGQRWQAAGAAVVKVHISNGKQEVNNTHWKLWWWAFQNSKPASSDIPPPARCCLLSFLKWDQVHKYNMGTISWQPSHFPQDTVWLSGVRACASLSGLLVFLCSGTSCLGRRRSCFKNKKPQNSLCSSGWLGTHICLPLPL